jgi:predicted DNA-binding transcriptional regulator YafY
MRADRLLSILLLLQVHRRVTARELSRRMEVSERTILRDMEALSSAGVPVWSERGVGGGWSLVDGYQTRLTGLTTAEIQSLFLARPTSVLADLGLQQEADAALLKLQASLPAASRRQADFARKRVLIDSRGWHDPGESIAWLPVLLDALWRERRLRFVYQRVSCDPAERTGDPLGLVAKGNTWYLVARIEGEPRTYRVSRIRDAGIIDEPADEPAQQAAFDLAQYWHRSIAEFRERLPRYYATFLVRPEVMQWVRYRGWRVEEETAEADRVRVRLRFDVEAEALQFALSFGADVEAVEPFDLRAKVVESARGILTVYGGPDAG